MGVAMDDGMRRSECVVCHELTPLFAEPVPGHLIFVCHDCLDLAKEYFIFVCMRCGKVHKRSKEMWIKRVTDLKLKEAYIACRDHQIIQGIEMCVECDPDGILKYMDVGGMMN